MGLGNPHPADWSRFEIDPHSLNKSHSLLRGQGFHPINSGGFLALVILRNSTYRKTFG
jgi:hypothetical protein